MIYYFWYLKAQKAWRSQKSWNFVHDFCLSTLKYFFLQFRRQTLSRYSNALQNILLQNCLNNMYSFSKKITGLTCSRHFLKYSFWWCHVAFFMEWCFYQLYLVYLDLNLTLMFKTIQVQVWNLHQVPQHRLLKHGMKKIKSDNSDKICDKIENICKSMHIK